MSATTAPSFEGGHTPILGGFESWPLIIAAVEGDIFEQAHQPHKDRPKAVRDIFEGSIGLALHEVGADGQNAFIAEKLMPIFGSITSQAPGFCASVKRSLDRIDRGEVAAKVVGDALTEELRTDADKRVTFMRFLAAAPEDILPEEEKVARAVRLWDELNKAGSLIVASETLLKKGEFDSSIAHELLQRASMGIDRRSSDAAGLEALKQQTEFQRGTNHSPRSSDEEVFDRMVTPQSREVWLPEAQTLLRGTKAALEWRMAANAEARYVALREEMLIMKKVTPQDFNARLRIYARHLQVSNERAYQPTKAQVIAQTAKRAKTPEAKKPKQPNQLFVLNTLGKMVDMTSQEAANLKYGYLKRFKKNSGDVAEDLQRVIDFLQRLDMSEGIVAGIEGMSTTITVDGKPLSEYKLKPFEANDLSTRTQQANKMRVTFVMPSKGKIVITKIYHRDRMSRWFPGSK